MLPIPFVPFKVHENIASISANTPQPQDSAPQNLAQQIDNLFQVEQPTTQLEQPTAQLEQHDEPPEVEFDIGDEDDPKSFDQAMKSAQAPLWHKAILEELNSMAKNGVWTLTDSTSSRKPIGCKWVFKTKRDSQGRVERLKARLVAKVFTHREGFDYTDTFSPMSSKDSLRLIMALTAHFDLELHQMDVKTAFLNGDLKEDIFMQQPPGFVERGKEHCVCKLNKSIYGLIQASRQGYLKFDEVVTSFGFIENILDDCIYLKVDKSRFIFLVLYVDDILLASSDFQLLLETKTMLSNSFDMKDLGEAHYVLGIEIKRNRSRKLLGLSQLNYINKVLKRFNMEACSPGDLPIGKGDRPSRDQCPMTEQEQANMKNKPYASLVGSLMYAQVCTRPDLSFALSVLGRFQANPGEPHWVLAKKMLRYLKKTKSLMLMYGHVDNLELTCYSDSDLAGCVDDRKSTSGYFFFWLEVRSLGEAKSKIIYLHPLWRLNLLDVLKQLGKDCGSKFL
ncbi:hypothetical protein L3X38_043432 [Prunus dulcis]|uniref:Reverse transcriptase Ty1/copia-type domain-containing protein n=1 Tax=Prunus dulcis TaxID=3755 RepID=A0AAD4YM51_PRUDU|nr:hypothetical protein L3X38_043432 [Prunus dulcis]